VLSETLQALGAPVAFPRAFADATKLWQLAQHDKKARDGVVPMIVPTAIGAGAVVPLDAVRLAKALA